MSKDMFINAQLTRRQFHKLIERLEEDRDLIGQCAQDFKVSEEPDADEKYNTAISDLQDIDMLIAALYGED